MFERLHALETFGIKLGLANMERLCEALGHPERGFPSLHVAGTNGKGSVTAMAHAALRAAGLRAARYTSPHLVSLNERYVIGDAPVGDAELAAVADRVLDAADALVAYGTLAAPPTFFEAATAMAFELFRDAQVEVAVLEVGLGGRFDATNIVTPLVSAITSIGFDHQQHLGSTLGAIAFEKAGIIKPGVPVVMAPLPADAEAVVRQVAAGRGSRVVRADEGARMEARADEGRAIVEIATPAHRYRPVALALRGDHQVENALVTIRLLEEARVAGVPVTHDAIERGLSDAVWPARLELIELRGGRRLLLDSAHNADGAAALARYLARWHPERPPLVFGAMRDKDVTAILSALLPVVGPVVTTAPANRRAADPDTLVEEVRALDPARAVTADGDPMRALDRAFTSGRLACVAGSIFLAGEVRDGLHGRAILP